MTAICTVSKQKPGLVLHIFFGGDYFPKTPVVLMHLWMLLEKNVDLASRLQAGGLVGSNSSHTLPKTNSSPLQMDGWNTILSYWVKRPIFRGKPLVSGRVHTFRSTKKSMVFMGT